MFTYFPCTTFFLEYYRYASYKQYTWWIHKWLGKGARKAIPSRTIWAIIIFSLLKTRKSLTLEHFKHVIKIYPLEGIFVRINYGVLCGRRYWKYQLCDGFQPEPLACKAKDKNNIKSSEQKAILTFVATGIDVII